MNFQIRVILFHKCYYDEIQLIRLILLIALTALDCLSDRNIDLMTGNELNILCKDSIRILPFIRYQELLI